VQVGRSRKECAGAGCKKSNCLKLCRQAAVGHIWPRGAARGERFKEGLARFDAELMAARALLEAQIARVWQNPERSTGKDIARVAEQLQATVWITSTCVRVAEGCFELAGSTAVYDSSSLQRGVRDLRVAAQHFAAQPRNYVTAGAAVLARLSPASR
jgi:alkylation response protein AidB-like acyl-CoA dehydrogenase